MNFASLTSLQFDECQWGWMPHFLGKHKETMIHLYLTLHAADCSKTVLLLDWKPFTVQRLCQSDVFTHCDWSALAINKYDVFAGIMQNTFMENNGEKLSISILPPSPLHWNHFYSPFSHSSWRSWREGFFHRSTLQNHYPLKAPTIIHPVCSLLTQSYI